MIKINTILCQNKR